VFNIIPMRSTNQRLLDDPLGRRLFSTIPLGTLVFVAWLYGLLKATFVIVTLTWVGLPLVFSCIFPFIFDFGKPGLLTKLQSYDDRREASVKRGTATLWELIEFGTRGKTFYFLMLLVLALTVAYGAGRAKARSEQRFLVPDPMHDFVVARIYGENAICVQFNEKTKKLTGAIRVINVSDEKIGNCKWIPVGKLENDDDD